MHGYHRETCRGGYVGVFFYNHGIQVGFQMNSTSDDGSDYCFYKNGSLSVDYSSKNHMDDLDENYIYETNRDEENSDYEYDDYEDKKVYECREVIAGDSTIYYCKEKKRIEISFVSDNKSMIIIYYSTGKVLSKNIYHSKIPLYSSEKISCDYGRFYYTDNKINDGIFDDNKDCAKYYTNGYKNKFYKNKSHLFY